MRRAWEWFQEKARTKHAHAWLYVISFSEASFFLIPTEVFLIPILAAGKQRWLRISLLTSLTSVLGAIAGYLIGLYVFEPLAQPIISFYGLEEQFAAVGELYVQGTFWAVLTAAFTPIPFKVFVLAGGFFSVPFLPFILAAMLGRTVRYLAVGWISNRFGPRVAEQCLEHFNYITTVVLVLLAIAAAVYFDLPHIIF